MLLFALLWALIPAGRLLNYRHCIVYNGILKQSMVNIEKHFDYIEHTADTGIISYGANLADVFAHAAEGMFTLVCDLDSVRRSSAKKVRACSHDKNYETLLVEWLNELLYLHEVEHMLFARFEITNLAPDEVVATCYGEHIDLDRHSIKTEIKAATYHMLNISDRDGVYQAQIIFDL